MRRVDRRVVGVIPQDGKRKERKEKKKEDVKQSRTEENKGKGKDVACD